MKTKLITLPDGKKQWCRALKIGEHRKEGDVFADGTERLSRWMQSPLENYVQQFYDHTLSTNAY